MSEYQYYEFQAIDRPLTEKEMEDLRALYLGWLAYIQDGYVEEDEQDEPEPPVPPGLGQLSAPLKSLAEFLRIENDLIDAAAEGSAPGSPAGPSKDELSAWIAAVP